MIHKGTFSDTNKMEEFDALGIRFNQDFGSWEIEFIRADSKTKSGKKIGKVTIPLAMAKTIARRIVNQTSVRDRLSPQESWRDHYEKTKQNESSPLLIKAVSLIKRGNNSDFEVLDLGCGTGVDVKYLLGQGFRVTAVDSSPIALEYIKKLPQEKLFFVNLPFEQFNFPTEKYDLINAQWSLPYVSSSVFPKLFEGLLRSLKVGGVFAGQLFGKRDDLFIDCPEMTFLTKFEVEKILKNLKVYEFREEEHDRKNIKRVLKHSHVFQIIASK